LGFDDQDTNDKYFELIIERFKEFDCKDLSHPDMRAEFYELQDDLSETPSAADKVLALIAQLLFWAFNRRLVTANPAYRMTKLTAKHTRAHIVLRPRHHQLVREHADPDLARIYRFSLLALIRASDARKLRWSNLTMNGKWLVFEPSKTFWKTKQKVSLPIYLIPELKELIGTPPASGDDYIFKYKDAQWKARTLKQKWLDFRKEYLADDLATTHWHDIRGTGTQILLDAGCTNFETACITGHKFEAGPQSAESLRKYATLSKRGSRTAYRKFAAAIEKGCLVNEDWDEEDDDDPDAAVKQAA